MNYTPTKQSFPRYPTSVTEQNASKPTHLRHFNVSPILRAHMCRTKFKYPDFTWKEPFSNPSTTIPISKKRSSICSFIFFPYLCKS